MHSYRYGQFIAGQCSRSVYLFSAQMFNFKFLQFVLMLFYRSWSALWRKYLHQDPSPAFQD